MTRTDREIIDRLVSRAQAGDRAAFSQLVRLTMNDIVALTYRMTGDRDVAHDLAQETFVSAWEKLDGFRGDAKFENWLYRIASNKALNHIASVSSHRTDSLDRDSAIDPAASTNASPDVQLEREQLREGVLEFMQTLPPQQRTVFDLRFYRQLSFDEIAKTTGKAVGTVKTHYREAVAKLRIYATEKGWAS